MLVTDKFVFLHLPRAGGTFVYDVVKKFFPSAREIGYHFPRELLPNEYSHLPVLGVVRNPWEFYVSWYHHQHSNKRYSPLKNVLFGCLSEDRNLDFVQTLRNALDLGVRDDKLDVLIRGLPENFNHEEKHIPNLTKDLMQKIRGTGIGLYTFRFNQLFGQTDDVFFCRVESLRRDLMAFFERIGVATDVLRNYVLGLDKKNISEYRHYSTYYTPELAELVSIRDHQLVERFGFTFEGDLSDRKHSTTLESPIPPAIPSLVSLGNRGEGFEPGPKEHAVTPLSMREAIMRRKVGYGCGKIIISGNTANRYGKRALAVPVDMHITATWDKSDNIQEGLRILWAGHGEDGVWLTTVRKIIQLIEARVGPLSGELRIRNTLPLGRGLGSSTAIVAALARCFFGESCKNEALAIEDVINKGHSGLDFAVIWEKRPIVIQGNNYEFTDLPTGLQRGFLVDTGLPAAPTSQIVQRLKERISKEKVLMESVHIIGNCTERLLSGEDPLTVFPDHYRAQVTLGVVPLQVQSLIEKIQRSGGAAKAGRFGEGFGGVGMLFVVHPNVRALERVVGGTSISVTYNPLLSMFIAVEPSVQHHSSRYMEPAELDV
jgi:mevalonate kinase